MEMPRIRHRAENATIDDTDYDPSNDPDWPNGIEPGFRLRDHLPRFRVRRIMATAALIGFAAGSIMGASSDPEHSSDTRPDRPPFADRAGAFDENGDALLPGYSEIIPIIGEPHSESQPDGSPSDQIT